MEELKNIEKQEISKEILTEWYKEKGVFLEEKEKEKLKAEEEKISSPQPFFNTKAVTDENLKEKEEEKKLLVKNKIKYLLRIGEERGLEKSVEEAKKEKNPFLLDIYHDVLAKDGAYKKLLKK